MKKKPTSDIYTLVERASDLTMTQQLKCVKLLEKGLWKSTGNILTEQLKFCGVFFKLQLSGLQKHLYAINTVIVFLAKLSRLILKGMQFWEESIFFFCYFKERRTLFVL